MTFYFTILLLDKYNENTYDTKLLEKKKLKNITNKLLQSYTH